ncbi:MAG: response regulator [Alphaproteobacteria bacterium]
MGRLLDLSQDHIAIAAGDGALSRLIGGVLRDMGAGAVTLVADGPCAMAALDGRAFDALICHVDSLPRQGLAQFARMRLSGDDKTGLQRPVILLTSHPTRQSVRLAKAAGAGAVLAWPVSPIHIIRALARILGRPSPDDQAPAFWFAETDWAPRARPGTR